MKALIAHDTPEALLTASRRSKSVRTAHRILAIRDNTLIAIPVAEISDTTEAATLARAQTGWRFSHLRRSLQ